MSKAAQIQALNDGVRTTKQIALIVYGDGSKSKMAYVRVVLRQRYGKSYCRSSADWKYARSERGREIAHICI